MSLVSCPQCRNGVDRYDCTRCHGCGEIWHDAETHDRIASLERDLAEARGDARAKHGVSELAIRERDAAKRERDEVCARLSSAYGTCEMLERESKTLQGQRDAALRDLAELREAAREMREAFRAYDGAPHDERVANAGALYKRVIAAVDAMAALLPAEPPKEASDGK